MNLLVQTTVLVLTVYRPVHAEKIPAWVYVRFKDLPARKSEPGIEILQGQQGPNFNYAAKGHGMGTYYNISPYKDLIFLSV